MLTHLFYLIIIGWLFLCTPVSAWTKSIELPITVDKKLLNTMVQKSYFTEPGNKTTLVDKYDGCIKVVLSEPEFSPQDGSLRFQSRALIHVGTPIGGSCLLPMQWEGYVEFQEKPVFEPKTFTLSFKLIQSALYTLDHQPAKIASVLWNLASPAIDSYLDSISVNLAPPVENIKAFLLPMFDAASQKNATRMLQALRGGDVVVTKDGLVAKILADVDTVYIHNDAQQNSNEQPKLSQAQQDKIIEQWEAWDSFLMHLISLMTRYPLDTEERDVLAEVLLNTRHTFTEKLNDQTLGRDIVREQFVTSWKRLGPIFQNQIKKSSANDLLAYLGFFSAVDALQALDDLGPTFNIEISQAGLIRLLQMIGEKDNLNYDPSVNSSIRELFQLAPESDPGPTIEEDGIELDDLPEATFQTPTTLLNWLVKPVYAATLPSHKEIIQWRVPKTGIRQYVTRVRKVLSDAISALEHNNKQEQWEQEFFIHLIPAIAWQESCFRQFTVRKNKLTYLLSYNKSSVGLMQVNERVWRGLYDRNRLRWDISYNALAGSEITSLYLRKYVVRKSAGKKMPRGALLAQLLYAMYNGGPGQYSKFMKRHRAGKYFKSDKLFLEKYQWEKKGQWDKISQCLGAL